MATLVDSGYPTLLNIMKRLRPDGSIESMMAETLNKKLAILDDIPWKEGNLPTGHLITSRTGLPTPTWRRLNEGVDPAKSESAQYTESCGMLELYSNVDVALADLNGNRAAYRASEDKGIVEAIGQEAARSIFYESAASNPERIHGVAARYGGSTGYTSSSYVLPKGTRSGVNCESVWLINWNEDSMFGIYPKGSVAGLQAKDMGEQLVRDANNKQFTALVSHYVWKLGVAVKDYRYNVRMQWDPDDTTTFPDSGKTMYLALQEMIGTVYDLGPTARFYMSRVSYNKLNAQLASNSANFLEYIEDGRKRIPSFMGVPIRITDALIGESPIS